MSLVMSNGFCVFGIDITCIGCFGSSMICLFESCNVFGDALCGVTVE